MTAFAIRTLADLSKLLGDLREAYTLTGFVKGSYTTNRPRSSDQNAISHAWYGQLAAELREDDELGWKCYCKLWEGVPILRAEDEEFRAAYDSVIKPLTYEQKLEAMKFWPVTSIMTKAQLSKYLEAVQSHARDRLGVHLNFPMDKAA